MNNNIKFVFLSFFILFLLSMFFLFYPIDAIDLDRGVPYKNSKIFSQSENYFNTISSSNNLNRSFPESLK